MCGIAGFLADSGGVAPGRLARMLAALRHRGPDGEGTRLFSRRGETALVDGASERDPAAGLAHARLAVLDLSADGAEPMSNEDGSWWLTFNGEIYNHLALRNELTAAGHTFRSRCDAEVILHGLEAWGVGLPARLRGMYAWAALHLPSSSLWLARDPWGIKPVYLALTGSVTAFASELTALEAGGFTGGLSRQALEAYVGLGFVPSPLCLLEGVRKLRPGELVRVQGGRAETLGMVAPPMPPQHRTHQGALNAVESEVQEVLKDSVRAHLVSDVEVGTLLSGGIDSAVVTALAVEVHGGPVRAFTLAVDDPALDETELATHAARTLGVRHHVLRVGPDQARARLPALLGSLDEPLADPSILPTRLVAELAREHVKVVLSGDGGDELFLGYTRHRFMDALDRARTLGPLSTWAARAGAHLPARALDAAYGSLHGVLGLPDVVAPARKLAAAAESLREDRVLAYGRLFRAGTPAELTRLGLPHDPAIPVLRAAGEGYDGADAAGLGQAVDVRLWLPDDILAKVDRASMAVGLEARVPLIDVEVARVAASLPGYALRSGSTGKVVLRRLAEKRFGPGLARADKRGFGLPMRDWLAGPLRPWRTEALASLSDRGLFDGHGLRALQEAHDTGTDHAPILFALCALEMWLRARASVVA